MHINEGKDKLALVLFAAAVIVLVPPSYHIFIVSQRIQGYRRGTGGVQEGYRKGTVGYRKGTVGVQEGYRRGTGGV